jgi:hypothetical protein
LSLHAISTASHAKRNEALRLYAFPTTIASLMVHIKANCMLLCS